MPVEEAGTGVAEPSSPPLICGPMTNVEIEKAAAKRASAASGTRQPPECRRSLRRSGIATMKPRRPKDEAKEAEEKRSARSREQRSASERPGVMEDVREKPKYDRAGP